jgi:hypothetical protein
MKKISGLLAILLGLTILSCYSSRKINTTYAKNRNICKELKGKALVYMLFVDTRHNDKWTDFDINTAFKSAGEAADWLMARAKENGQQMDIEIKYFQSGKMRTVSKNLPAKTIKASLTFPTPGIGVYRLNRWADEVARIAGLKIKFPGEVDNSIIRKPKDNVEMISKLRDIYRVENVVLIYLLNNNYTNDISVAMNTISEKKIEYAIASYKTPQALTQLILQLFGAADLKQNVFNGTLNEWAPPLWPNEIMVNAKDPLEKLEIGPVTQYLIGWKADLDTSYVRFIRP